MAEANSRRTPDQGSQAITCPRCGRTTIADVVGTMVSGDWGTDEFHELPTDIADLYEGREEHSLLRCRSCTLPVVISRDDRELDPDLPPDFGLEFIFSWPEERRISSSVPRALSATWQEALTCCRGGAYRATVVMCRRLIEEVALDLGVSGRSLNAQLNKLREKEILDESLLEWANLLRDLGNDGAHANRDVVHRDDAIDAVNFGEALLNYIYVHRKRYEEVRARRTETAPTT